MKLLSTTVKPHELDGVRRALERHAVLGMTLSEVSQSGSGRRERRRGSDAVVDLTPAVHIESVVHDDLVERLLDELGNALGRGSEARVCVRQVVYVERVRTRERGADAV